MKTVATETCCLCGKHSEFKIKKEATLLREAGCCYCGASLRTADVARVLIETIGGGKHYATLHDCAEAADGLRILNLFSEGPIHKALCQLPQYSFGEYFDNVKSGDYYNGVRCIDLQNMPFADQSLDIIVTEDILEHVADINRAFREINRVLRSGGSLLFTVPVHEKNPTVSRIGNKNQVYHGDPLREAGALVMTDFGNDIPQILGQYGLTVREVEGHRFFSPEEISYIDEEYEQYQQKRQDLLQVFRYNSIVYVGTKGKPGFWQRVAAWFQ
jgi:SAM-dependent methyltransferase